MHKLISDKSVIFFDVGYTIDRPASGDWMFTNLFYELVGEKLKQRTEKEIEEARAEGLDYLEKIHLIRDEREETDQFYHYYHVVSKSLGLKLSEGEIMELAKDRTYNMNNYVIYTDARDVIQTLSKTHRLGIISDTWPSIENQLRTLNVRQFFSFTTYSFSLGVFKPDKRMYLDALKKCGCDAGEAVFIDDSTKNLEGAEALGITPILIAANPAADVETKYEKIYSLSELI
ncbi:MAG: HAD-IA family hydrolase [Lachnospiraceae bacterium]|nr:HAD-IA family hydrolase [Lachnospiraceae bacterium]